MFYQVNICLLTMFVPKNNKLNGFFPTCSTSSSKYTSNSIA